MELQAIREKLQLLQAEPPAAETLSLPWSAPLSANLSVQPKTIQERPNGGQETPQANQQSPQAIAIEALKKRSGNTLHPANESSAAASSQADNLIAQEIYRLEVQAHNINMRSQQQAEEMMAMKRSAQQAAVTLGRQGIYNHPKLAAIAELFEHQPSAVVPHIEKDDQGRFALTYDTIDFYQAQQDAMATAEALRQRSAGGRSTVPFSEPIELGSVGTARNGTTRNGTDRSTARSTATGNRSNNADASPGPRLKLSFEHTLGHLMAPLKALRLKHKRQHREGLSHSDISEVSDDEFDVPLEDFYSAPAFSWMDGAIWFSGAAIARIVVGLLVAQYPVLSMPLLIALVATIGWVIYRVLASKTSDYSIAYRLFIALLGLFSVSLF